MTPRRHREAFRAEFLSPKFLLVLSRWWLCPTTKSLLLNGLLSPVPLLFSALVSQDFAQDLVCLSRRRRGSSSA